MRHKRHTGQAEDTEIDMTPMLDIVFIMLIFFIVTTSFVKEAGVTVNRPSAQTAVQQDQNNILVAITKDDQVWIDRRQVEVTAIRPVIERLYAENPEGAVVIQADEDARTGLLVQVMDQVRLSGIENISLAAEVVQ